MNYRICYIEKAKVLDNPSVIFQSITSAQEYVRDLNEKQNEYHYWVETQSDNYDYAKDDMNFDAAREKRFK
jgi:hypothetical protein